jgi:hypothetical protein
MGYIDAAGAPMNTSSAAVPRVKIAAWTSREMRRKLIWMVLVM